VRHGPWFVETYGSLAVWNNQGMEKSHHAAKAANQHHTQHGGTKDKTSAIVQQYQHWYRNIQHRFAKQEQLRAACNVRSQENEAASVASMQKKRTAYNASNAAEGARKWREDRIRVGRAWVREVEGEGVANRVSDSLSTNTGDVEPSSMLAT
jgi:hypothetical protein